MMKILPKLRMEEQAEISEKDNWIIKNVFTYGNIA
jgi:hypothetical protein